MKKIVFILIFANALFAQDLSLETCLDSAKTNYPLFKNKEILESTLELNISKLNFGWIPRLKLNAQATYQSDVTSLPFNSNMLTQFGIDYTPLEKDQYNINLEIAQPLFDAGNIMTQKQVVRAQTDTKKAELENDLYQIQQSVKDVYFTILLLDLQIKQNEIHINELRKNYKNLENRFNLGVALNDDLDKLNIEILSAERSKLDLESQKEIAINTLELLTNLDIRNATLEVPDFQDAIDFLESIRFKINDELFKNRPEINYFAVKNDEIEIQKKVELNKSLPYIDIFFQGGYGYPGLNILKSGFSLYYTAGLRFSWEFSNLYSKSQQDEIIVKQQLEINSKKEEFILNAKISLNSYINKALSILNQLKTYESSIDLSQKIVESSEQKMVNGIININDFITDINNLNLIKLEQNYQRIDFFSQIYQIKQVLNNF